MQTIPVQDYAIYLGDIFPALNDFLAKKATSALVIIVDENTERCCLPLLQSKLDRQDFTLIRIPAGEIHKTIQTCQLIWQQMMDNGINRNALCINLGGGVIGDMGGFSASTYKRGIDFIQIPTTLLSQVDASIGGKLGIDFNHVKNSVGVFRNPQGVFISPTFLKTLSKEEIRSGFAEIIKHSLIDNLAQWERIQQIKDLDAIDWLDFLAPSLQIKKRIVEIDPFEKGLRKALNFGHTIGHAVESQYLTSKQPLLHGEAVAVGMICESYISHHISGLPLADLEVITDFLIGLYGKYRLLKKDYPAMIQLMRKDKKNEQDEINFTLLTTPGTALVNQTCEVSLIKESLDFYRNISVENSVIR